MAESGGGSPEEQQGAQAELQKLGQEIGPLAKRLQEKMQDPDADPKEVLKIARRLSEIMDKFRGAMPPEQFAEQFGGLEQLVNQALGSKEP